MTNCQIMKVVCFCILAWSVLGSASGARASESSVFITIPTDAQALSVHNGTIDISGSATASSQAGMQTTILGDAVVCADLSHSGLTSDATVTIHVVTAATQAVHWCPWDFTVAFARDDTVIINGVHVYLFAGQVLHDVLDSINAVADQTGVDASTCGNTIVLKTREYGATAQIVIGGTGAYMFQGVATDGINLIAMVADQHGNPVGRAWTSEGFALADDLGNSILLTKNAATAVNTYSDQIHVQVTPEPYISYTNITTGESGNCSGVASWSADGIRLIPGQNLIRVSLMECGSETVHDDITVRYYPPANAPGATRKMNDGAYVSLTGQVVTASGSETGTYIESPDRSSGIGLVGADVPRGSIVSLDGVISTIDGERVLIVDSISQAGNESVSPLAVTNFAITGNCGLETTGLLVRTSGRVISTDEAANSFVISDGSSNGIRCLLPSSVPVNPEWKYLIVTGISSYSGGRVLKVRDINDINIVE